MKFMDIIFNESHMDIIKYIPQIAWPSWQNEAEKACDYNDRGATAVCCVNPVSSHPKAAPA